MNDGCRPKMLMLIVGSLLLILAALMSFDRFVAQPQRLEKEKLARRESLPKLVRPSLRAGADAEREVVTAFRAEEWRIEEPEVALQQEPADAYLTGYLLVQDAEKKLESGERSAAREKFLEAAKQFDRIKNGAPDFEPAMVDFRMGKIDQMLSTLNKPLQVPAKPQSSINGHQGGAAGVDGEMQLAQK